MRVADVRDGRLAVIGQCPITAGELSRHVARLSGLADLDALAMRLPGSFHLAATMGGEVRVQGSVSGLRRVYHGRVGDVAIASDQADVISALSGADVDVTRLALRLLFPAPPAPLGDASPWRDVHAVAPGDYLSLDRTGRARERTWWRPPEPSLSLVEGAAGLANALSERMSALARDAGDGLVGGDLSGGLDSTSLCFLAAGTGVRLSCVTHVGIDPGNDDARFAREAAAALSARGDLTHHVIDPDAVPPAYAALWEPGEALDQPFAGLRDAAKIVFGIERTTPAGARHVSGFGADEVLQAPSAALHTIVRERPRLAPSYIKGLRSRYRWPLRPVLRALADRRDYAGWLADAADEVAVFGSIWDTSLALTWDGPFRVPPWVTGEATESIRRLMRDAAAGAQPLAASRGQHATIMALHRGAAVYRLAQRFVGRTGRELVMPFLDDRVVDTCLSVRLEERTTPWRYKPLLVEAMRGTVPDTLLARSTKGHTASELFQGLRRFRPQLSDLLDDPILGRLGLVDVPSLRNACLGLYPPTVPIVVVEATLACEVWLRAVTHAPRPLTGGRR